MVDLKVLKYGTVVGRFLVELADSDDTDLNPDVFPAQGYIVFTPGTSFSTVTFADPDPAIVFPQKVIGVLDADGYLCTALFNSSNNTYAKTIAGDYVPSRRGVSLQATDDTSMNPSDWTWNAEFHFKYAGSSIPFASFNFSLPSGKTTDLTQVKPKISNTGEYTIIGPQGPRGEKGDQGTPNTLSVGTVKGLPTGSTPSATITGVSPNQTLNLSLPEGPVGPSGGPIPAGGAEGQTLRKGIANGYSWTEGKIVQPTALTSSDNLNNLLITGIYDCPDAAIATSANNYPIQKMGQVEVSRTSPTKITQTFEVYDTANPDNMRTYIRNQIAGTWYSWKEYQLVSNIPAASASTAGFMSSADKTKLDNATAAATGSRLAIRYTDGSLGVAAPTSGTDATNKTYVDTMLAEGRVGAKATIATGTSWDDIKTSMAGVVAGYPTGAPCGPKDGSTPTTMNPSAMFINFPVWRLEVDELGLGYVNQKATIVSATVDYAVGFFWERVYNPTTKVWSKWYNGGGSTDIVWSIPTSSPTNNNTPFKYIDNATTKPYSADAGPILRRIGDTVFFSGVQTTTADITTATVVQFGWFGSSDQDITAFWTPNNSRGMVWQCQGSGSDKWVLQWYNADSPGIARYTGNPGSNVWLPFSVSWPVQNVKTWKGAYQNV